MPKKTIVVPDKWYIQIGDHTFVGPTGLDVSRHEAIAFPSARSAWVYRLDAFGRHSNLSMLHVKGKEYEVNETAAKS